MDSSTDSRAGSLSNLKQCNSVPLPVAAMMYNMMGLKIIKVRPREKKAYGDGWNEPQYSDGYDHWQKCPTDNIGLPLGRNHLFVVDIDDMENYLKVMEAITPLLKYRTGVDKMFYELDTIRIVSGRPGSGKLMFKIPADIEDDIHYNVLKWTKEGGKGRTTIVEFRCGDGVQDILPPSIHPTLSTYHFAGADAPIMMPADLVDLVMNFDFYLDPMQKVNPHYVNEPKPIVKNGRTYKGENYYAQWSNMQDIGAMLLKYGYKQEGKRFLSPDSHSMSAGVVILPGTNKFYSHGESDYFADGKAHDAYDLLLHFECNDDHKAAWERIKSDLGITQEMINNNRTRTFWKGTDDW